MNRAGERAARRRERHVPPPPARGYAFRGTRTLDLIVIVRVFVCLIIVAALSSGIIAGLFRMGILKDPQRVPLFVLVTTIVLSALVTQLVLSIMLHRLLKPIRELREAMERVAQGDFSARVDDEGADNELGSLVRGFNAMAAELGSIEELRDTFVDDFSHELKTPMVSIRGFARQIARDEGASAETREYAGIIEQEADRLVGMSAHALELSRLESQQVAASPQAFSLDEQLRRCILMLQERWEGRGVEMDVELPPTRAFGNAEMLEQVWLNVLDNAVKYSPAGACVHVRCWQEGPKSAGGGAAGDGGAGEARAAHAIVSVRDEGPGMDEATLRRAFDKFFRGAATAGAAPGNGLGLPIVRRVVELSGGRIEVRTEPGRGTDFRVELPG